MPEASNSLARACFHALTRRYGPVELLVVCNVSSDYVEVEIAEAETWADAEVLLRTPDSPGAQPPRGRQGPWEARVLRRSD